ncbi:hypothetical protein SB778_46240, partial [Paraburkholderia sp. SIMBA_050]
SSSITPASYPRHLSSYRNEYFVDPRRMTILVNPGRARMIIDRNSSTTRFDENIIEIWRRK